MVRYNLDQVVAGFLLVVPSLVSASTFSTNCTLPTQSSTLVTSANIRGTFDILWSGLFIIFICIWTVQHLNVPEQRDGQDQGWRGDLKWAWKGFTTKFKWMILTLILPESLLGKALSEYAIVHHSLRLMKQHPGGMLRQEEVDNWTKVHCYYADMGGFVLRTSNLRGDGQSYAIRHLVKEDVFILRERGLLASLPTIRASQINDMSKGDFFAKAAAVAQVSWMVIQVVARGAKGLPITQLEITACAFAATTFITYVLWWEKPQSVYVATELELPTPLHYEDVSKNLSEIWRASGFWLYRIFQHDGNKPSLLGPDEPLGNDSVWLDGRFGGLGVFAIGTVFGSVVLGGIQCAAWYFEFPSDIEMYLWRCASVVTVAVVPLFAGAGFLLEIVILTDSRRLEYVLNVTVRALGLVAAVAYIIARLFLLFETMYSLFHLPKGAFIATW